jgi:hypothetical protein
VVNVRLGSTSQVHPVSSAPKANSRQPRLRARDALLERFAAEAAMTTSHATLLALLLPVLLLEQTATLGNTPLAENASSA